MIPKLGSVFNNIDGVSVSIKAEKAQLIEGQQPTNRALLTSHKLLYVMALVIKHINEQNKSDLLPNST